MDMARLTLMHIYLLSLVPTFEGRYALVVGIASGLGVWESFTVASLGVLTLAVILPLVLPYTDRLALWLSKKRIALLSRVSKAYLYYSNRAKKKVSRYVDSYGFIGLIIFVALPLPGTGVWTGAIAAQILGMRRNLVITALLLGGILSNVLTLSLTLLGYSIVA